MRITDEAWVLDCSRFGENKFILTTLSHTNGIVKGMVRGKSPPQCGDYIQLEWSARLAEHLGNLKVDLLHRTYARMLDDGAKLAALRSAASLLAILLPLHSASHAAFRGFERLVKFLQNPDWIPQYVCWELELLTIVGYGLDLKLPNNNPNRPQMYVIPKSGKVTLAANNEDKTKLLVLPEFLHRYATKDTTRGNSPKSSERCNLTEIKQGLSLTGYFLSLALHGKAVPSRKLLLELV